MHPLMLPRINRNKKNSVTGFQLSFRCKSLY